MPFSYYTKEGYRNLSQELNELRTTGRADIAKQLSEARDKGDLSENAEYDAAKEAQRFLELKITKLEKTFAEARIIDKSQIDTSKVAILSTVKIKNITTNTLVSYTLVSQKEADLQSGKVSIESPIGKSLLKKSVGDIVEVKAPRGILRLKVMDIS